MRDNISTKMILERAVSLVAVVAVFVGIFVLTAQTVEETSALSNIFARLFGIENVRKWAHMVEFFVFGCVVACAAIVWFPAIASRHPARLFVGSFIFCAVASLFDQTHKLFVPGREFDITDFPFDICGYGLAIVFVAGIWHLWKRRKRAGGT